MVRWLYLASPRRPCRDGLEVFFRGRPRPCQARMPGKGGSSPGGFLLLWLGLGPLDLHVGLMKILISCTRAIYYSRILYDNKKIFPHKFSDITAMKGIGCFDQLLQDMEDFCLTSVFAFKHPWNREIILQFYATLYIFGDESDSSKWIMEWMTEGRRIKCTSRDFFHTFISLVLSMVKLKSECTTLMPFQMICFRAPWIRKRFVTTMVFPSQNT